MPARQKNRLIKYYYNFDESIQLNKSSTQIPLEIVIVALRSKKKIKQENYTVQFVKFPSKRFFGYKKEQFGGKDVSVSPEDVKKVRAGRK